MTGKRTSQIPQEKIERVSELVDTIKNKKTILLASIKNIPSSQYQEIVKMLRGKAIVKFPKKTILFRAFDSSDQESIKKLKDHVRESTAVLFSDIDSFELAAELLSKKTPAKAKPGQEAPEDIVVQAGPTDLVPGPAISELGAVGIQIQIEKGKIHIKEPSVIVKKGGKISSAAADVMNKLDIKPFSVGFTPFAAFDKESGKIYLDINIDKEKTIEELKYAFGKALPFAVEIEYFSEDTIKFIIGKAGSHEKAIANLLNETESKDGKLEDNDSGEQEESKESKAESDEKSDEKVSEESEGEKEDEVDKENDQNKSKEEK